jgi:hypothetical protein
MEEPAILLGINLLACLSLAEASQVRAARVI